MSNTMEELSSSSDGSKDESPILESPPYPPPPESSDAIPPSVSNSTPPPPPPNSDSSSPPPPSPPPSPDSSTHSPPPPYSSTPPPPPPLKSPPPPSNSSPPSPPHSPPPSPSPPPTNSGPSPSPPPPIGSLPPPASSVSPPPSPSPPPPAIPNQLSPPPLEIFSPPPPNSGPANPLPTPAISYSPPPPASESSGILSPPSQFFPSFAEAPPTVNPSSLFPGLPTEPTPPVVFTPPSIPSISTPQDPQTPDPVPKLTPPSNPSNSGSSNTATSNPSSTSSSNHVTVIGATVTGVVIVTMFVFFFFIRRKKKTAGGQVFAVNYGPTPRPGNLIVQSDGYYYIQHAPGLYNGRTPLSPGIGKNNGSSGLDSGVIGGSLSCFSYEELMEITNGFSKQNVLGEGGFGYVYKGWLPDGRVVAVKQLKAGSGQGEREFRAEVEIISRVHHRHLVSLVGYCIAEHHRLLVYEFLPNNNLEHHLHGRGMPMMEWSKRVKIALGAARGLAYLHEDCNPKIIHRDIKSANLLLDDAFEAQVADFGLAKLTNDARTHVSTRVVGTIGYMAPEYASSGKLTDRSDVYSFGVVLLELVTGRKPIDPNQPLGDESLVEWARPLLIHALDTGNFTALIDPRLERRYVESEMVRMIEAAAACVRHSAPKRPRMVQIARALDSQSDMPTDLTNGVKLGQSTAYDSAQYSAEIRKFRKMAFGSWESSNYDMFSGEFMDKSSTGVSLELGESSSLEFPSSDSESHLINPLHSEQGNRFKPR